MNHVEKLKEQIIPVLRPYVKRISVFGSFARSEETSESDIDLLVELKASGDRPALGLKWFGLERELSEALGHEVELVTDTSLSPYLRAQIQKSLITLYEER